MLINITSQLILNVLVPKVIRSIPSLQMQKNESAVRCGILPFDFHEGIKIFQERFFFDFLSQILNKGFLTFY